MGKKRSGGLSVGAVIVAAGSGTRMKGLDKIFMELAGRSTLEWTVSAFESSDSVSDIVIVLPQQKIEKGIKLAKANGWKKVRAICAGGERRQDSVSNGLARLQHCDYVMVHDGARPCVSQRIISEGLETAMKHGAAIPGTRVTDTIKKVDGSGFINGTVNREELIAVQTPQIFKWSIIAEAYRRMDGSVTDDASLVEATGNRVKIFEGSTENIKITTRDDVQRALQLLLKSGRAGV